MSDKTRDVKKEEWWLKHSDKLKEITVEFLHELLSWVQDEVSHDIIDKQLWRTSLLAHFHDCIRNIYDAFEKMSTEGEAEASRKFYGLLNHMMKARDFEKKIHEVPGGMIVGPFDFKDLPDMVKRLVKEDCSTCDKQDHCVIKDEKQRLFTGIDVESDSELDLRHERQRCDKCGHIMTPVQDCKQNIIGYLCSRCKSKEATR